MKTPGTSHELTITTDPPRFSMRYPAIDWMRGVAIVLVILVHLRIRIPRRSLPTAETFDAMVSRLTSVYVLHECSCRK